MNSAVGSRFIAAFEQAPVGIAHSAPDGTLIAVNRRVCELLGMTSEQLLASGLSESLHPEDAEEDREAWSRLLSGELDSFTTEQRRLRHDGTGIATRLHRSVVRDDRGAAGMVISIIEPAADDRVVRVSPDVTQQRAAVDALHESHERYRMMFEANPMPMWVYDRETLAFLDVNTAAMRQYGYSREEFLALTLLDIRPQEEIPGLLAALARPVRELHTTTGWRHATKDGRILEVEIVAHPITFSGRECELVLARDVTGIRRTEREIRKTASVLQAVVNDSPVAIVAMDTELLVTRWNQAAERMLGWPAAEMMGRPFEFVIPAEHLVEFHDKWRRILAGETIPRFEARYRRADRVLVDADVSVAALHDPDGSMGGAILILIDVTQHRHLESQLRQSQKMEAVGQLAGGVAHDFNNLLTAITSYSELVLLETPPDDARHSDILEIKHAADRAAALTGQLLAFSRQQVVRPRVLSLNAVITGLRKLLRRLVREDVELDLVLDQSIGAIEADPGQLEQVIMNLVVNACDAIHGIGRVTIATSSLEVVEPVPHQPDGSTIVPGRFVMLTVSDTGTGIDAEVLTHVFEPFFTTKERGKGTGLGLSTVYGIVKQSRGYIGCDSEPGHGTTFRIYLPQASGVAIAPEKAARTPPPAEPGNEVVMLVEDDDSVRMVARRILTRFGYTVLEASRGAEALALIERNRDRVDLVITDMVMPGMSGPELVGRLRERDPALRVLFISGYSRDVAERNVVFSQGSAYLEKPFTPDGLAASVRTLLGTPPAATP